MASPNSRAILYDIIKASNDRKYDSGVELSSDDKDGVGEAEQGAEDAIIEVTYLTDSEVGETGTEGGSNYANDEDVIEEYSPIKDTKQGPLNHAQPPFLNHTNHTIEDEEIEEFSPIINTKDDPLYHPQPQTLEYTAEDEEIEQFSPIKIGKDAPLVQFHPQLLKYNFHTTEDGYPTMNDAIPTSTSTIASSLTSVAANDQIIRFLTHYRAEYTAKSDRELRKMCNKRSIVSYGRKAQVVERLVERALRDVQRGWTEVCDVVGKVTVVKAPALPWAEKGV